MIGRGQRLRLYVLWRVCIGVAVMLTIVAAVVLMIEIVELARTVGGGTEVGFFDLGQLALMKTPGIVMQLLAFVFLFGAMGALVALNRRGELIAIRAAGLSAWSFALPSAAAAILVGLGAIVIVNPWAAELNRDFEQQRALLTGGPSRPRANEIWLRQGDGHGQIVIHARHHQTDGEALRLGDVSMFVQQIGPSGGLDFFRRIEAAEARLSPGFWRLTDVREIAPGGESERSEQLSIPSGLDRTSAMEKFVSPGAVSVWRLGRTIRAAKAAGYSAVRYEVRLQQLLATPLLLGGMTLLAATFSLRLTRMGQLPLMAATGVGAGFVVFFINALCGALGSAEVVPPLVAGWSPPLLILCFSAATLCYTEDG
ncbi:MAG: LptF/LptG family permease [Caulobacteraceae bacterium]